MLFFFFFYFNNAANDSTYCYKLCQTLISDRLHLIKMIIKVNDRSDVTCIYPTNYKRYIWRKMQVFLTHGRETLIWWTFIFNKNQFSFSKIYRLWHKRKLFCILVPQVDVRYIIFSHENAGCDICYNHNEGIRHSW